jgi:hypothetical protein
MYEHRRKDNKNEVLLSVYKKYIYKDIFSKTVGSWHVLFRKPDIITE